MKTLIPIVVCIAATLGARAQTTDFEQRPTISWRFTTKKPIYSSPVVSDNVAYFGGLDSTLYAVDVATGSLKWKLRTNGEIRSSPVVTNDRIYLAGGNGLLTCANKKTGVVIWRTVFDPTALFLGERRYDFADYYHSTPLVDGGTIFLGSGSGRIKAFQEQDGSLIWSTAVGDIVHNTAVIVNSKLYVGSFDGVLYALDIHTGQILWRFKTVGHQYFPKGEVQGSPVSGNGMIYFGARDYNVYAVDAMEGFAHWNRSFSGGWAVSNSVRDSILLIGTSDDRVVVAADARDGRELWKTNVHFNVFGQCISSAKIVYVPTIWGALYGIDRKTGSIRWTFTTDGYNKNHLNYYKKDDSFRDDIFNILRVPSDWIDAEQKMGGLFSTPVLDKDKILITSLDGTLYCLKKS